MDLPRYFQHHADHGAPHATSRATPRNTERVTTYDKLTGLSNRQHMLERIRRSVEIDRAAGSLGAVLLIDLDRFQYINESLGHRAGDRLLSVVSQRLRRAVQPGVVLARLGSDQFAVLLDRLEGPEQATRLAQHLIETVQVPLALQSLVLDEESEGVQLYISACIGIRTFGAQSDEAEQLLQHADAAMHRAKTAGRGSVRSYAPTLTTQARKRLETEARLHRAIACEEFVLHYQPLVDCRSLRIVGVEALMRWLDPQRGLLLPRDFLSVAEEAGCMPQLDRWVLRTACRQMMAWQAQGIAPDRMAVNLSAQTFAHDDVVDLVRETLAQTGLAPACLEIEITEGSLMDTDIAAPRLHLLHDLGVRLAIDNFGTGYSSLAYLSRFPIDKLKVDRSFVAQMLVDRTSAAIADAVIALGQGLELEVLAEGVERRDQLAHLRQRGCDCAQGWLFGQAAPAEVVSAALQQRRVAV
jgi:diguanylate cyclase (GGDEF)-like protein